MIAPITDALGRARTLLPWPRRASADASAAMFTHIRHRLTLWYGFVLLAALLMCGAVLYSLVRDVLLGPANQELSSLTRSLPFHAQDACTQGPIVLSQSRNSFYLACFDSKGILQQSPGSDNSFSPSAPAGFASEPLAKQAIQSNSNTASDVANVPGVGPVERRAIAFTDQNGNPSVVFEVGISVDSEYRVLGNFLVLLLGVGALALIVAVLGGLFLARRALAPARLAFARQQSFIADASHELRTPLTLLRADAEVLLRGGDRLTPDDRLLLEDIVTEAEHMTALAGTMLTLARLDADQLRIERDVVDLAAIAARVAHRAAALAREKEVTLAVEGAEPSLVIGDRQLLEQVTLILVDNAVKYNHPGGQVILRAGHAGDEATLDVCDTGIGIAGEHLPHLGERFYRVDKARSREAGGAGLGLSIARGVANAHGGALTLSSTPGAGTIARLRLPAAGDGRRATGEG